jgi:hypothetical protein
MEPRQRTQLIQALVAEARLMRGVLEQAIEAKQMEAKQRTESQHITDDEPAPPPASTIQDEHTSWGKVLRALTDIQTELYQIEYSEHQRTERFTPSDDLSRRAGRDDRAMLNNAGSRPMEHFTLEAAKRWIGRTVITKAAFDVDHRQLAAEQQGTVIGVHGQHTAPGDPVICLAVQFWPQEPHALPTVFFFDKRVFDEYLCLSQTVASSASS